MSDIVRETLDEVLTPIIYAEALELIEEHKTGRSQDRDRLVVADRDGAAARRASRRRRRDRDPRPARRARPLHRPARVLRVRPAQGRRDPRDGGEGGHRPRELLRLLRLDHRPADARAGRPPGGGEPRPRAHARRARTRLGHAVVPASGAACATACRFRRRARRWRPAVRPPRSERVLRCTCGCAGARSEGAERRRRHAPRRCGPSWRLRHRARPRSGATRASSRNSSSGLDRRAQRSSDRAVSTDLIRLFRELPAGFVAFLVGFVQCSRSLPPSSRWHCYGDDRSAIWQPWQSVPRFGHRRCSSRYLACLARPPPRIARQRSIHGLRASFPIQRAPTSRHRRRPRGVAFSLNGRGGARPGLASRRSPRAGS